MTNLNSVVVSSSKFDIILLANSASHIKTEKSLKFPFKKLYCLILPLCPKGVVPIFTRFWKQSILLQVCHHERHTYNVLTCILLQLRTNVSQVECPSLYKTISMWLNSNLTIYDFTKRYLSVLLNQNPAIWSMVKGFFLPFQRNSKFIITKKCWKPLTHPWGNTVNYRDTHQPAEVKSIWKQPRETAVFGSGEHRRDE